MVTVSQAYFDELCVENRDVFDSSEDEAVQETLLQLASNGSDKQKDDADDDGALAHLTLTYPTSSDGVSLRQQIEHNFQDPWRMLVQFAAGTTTGCGDDHNHVTDGTELDWGLVKEALTTLYEQIPKPSNVLFANLFLVQNGFELYPQVFAKLAKERKHALCLPLLNTIHEIVSTRQKRGKFRDAFQNAITRDFADTWEVAYGGVGDDLATALVFWKTVHLSIVRCERNKKMWMKTEQFVARLLGTLKHVIGTKDESLGSLLCQIVMVLGTFDDFCGDPASIVVQSGHNSVQALAKEGAVEIVHSYLLTGTNKASICAAMNALRSMAIQDDIVQMMRNQKVLETVRNHLDMSEPETLAAAVGLFRNVSANDDIKTYLCNDAGLVASIVNAMQTYPDHIILQEHAAGLTAAMSLRRPQNAHKLVSSNLHVCIVAAMQTHPANTSLQRQAALALRNLVSRSPELRIQILNDCDTEHALRHIAAKHLTCQDEVYAALRDLGLPAPSLHVTENIDGTRTVKSGREMFGQCQSNFRAVFD
jgi:hypothetical protein